MEQAFFFQGQSGKLFGVIHSPRRDNDTKIGVVFCAPMAEEKHESYPTFVHFARKLSEKGFWVLRFDYFGTGDSEGEWEQATLHSRINDTLAAIEQLQSQGLTEVGLLGLRFGGTIACLAASNDESIVSFLILWDPIVNGKGYLLNWLRTYLVMEFVLHRQIQKTRDQIVEDILAGKKVNVEGYLLGKEFFTEVVQVDLRAYPQAFARPTLLVQLSPRSRTDYDLRHPLVQQISSGSDLSTVAHVPCHSFWQEPLRKVNPLPSHLFTTTISWICKVITKVPHIICH